MCERHSSHFVLATLLAGGLLLVAATVAAEQTLRYQGSLRKASGRAVTEPASAGLNYIIQY